MSDVKFIFVRDNNNFPVGCFAYGDVFETGKPVPSGMSYGYSIYYFGDKFDRARARQVAQARLEKDPRAVFGNLSQEEMVLQMLRATAKTEIHQWAKRLAKDPEGNNEYVNRQLGHRFLGACVRTGEKLAAVIKRRKEAA